MPQIISTTSTPLGYTLTTLQTQLNGMIARMSAGWPILASDVAALVDTYNAYAIHYHTASDLRGIQTYGNLSKYSTSGTYVASTASTPIGVSPAVTPANVSVNSEITAADINAIIGLINSIRVHNHTINDVTS